MYLRLRSIRLVPHSFTLRLVCQVSYSIIFCLIQFLYATFGVPEHPITRCVATSASSQARTMEQFVCGTPRRERKWQAHLLDTRIRSGLWLSHQMASASSQAQTIKQFVCGTPRRERQRKAHLLDTTLGSGLWHSLQMASGSSQVLLIE